MTHSQIEQHDIVDRYLAGRLPPEAQSEFEDHFLACPHCLGKLEHDSGPVAAIVAACANPQSAPLSLPAWGLSAALVAIALLVTTVARPPTQHIELTAYRSGAPAGFHISQKPFVLKLDLRGLPLQDTYTVTILTESGRQIWSAPALRTGTQWLEVPVPTTPLPPGPYFVRLSTLREYALPVQ